MSRNLTKPLRHKGLTVTKRDEQVLLGLHRFRFMSTEQIEALTGSASRSKLNTRLRQLWSVDLVDRPELQRTLFAYAKKRPTIHALGNAGAKWLTDNHSIPFPRSVDWRAKNKAIKSGIFIEHTLGVTDTMLQAERDINAVNGLRVIDRSEVWACSPRFKPGAASPYELPTYVDWTDGKRVKRATKPDYTFAIADGRGERTTRGLFFLEYDNNTEDYVKSSARQTSILQKLLGYADVHKRKLHTDLYNYNRFRVLFVVAGKPERVANMIAVYQSHVASKIPAGAFLFTTKDQLEKEGFLAPIWLSGRNNKTVIVAR